MIKKIIIKALVIKNTKKDGIPYKDKNGVPFKMAFLSTVCGITASMYLHDKYGAKDLEVIQQWKEGDELLLLIEKDGNFTNFKIPSKIDLLESRITKIEAFLKSKFTK